jgi:hypothetical protein
MLHKPFARQGADRFARRHRFGIKHPFEPGGDMDRHRLAGLFTVDSSQ